MKKVLFLLPAAIFFFLLPFTLAAEGEFENRLREAELSGDRGLAESVCKEWYSSGKCSPGMLNWNYNALMSVEENALLFTQNDNDTYPALLLQYALKIRPDVRIINLQLIENQEYRNYLVQAEHLEGLNANLTLPEFIERILNQPQPARPVYLGSMLEKTRLQADGQKLYLTGLALKFSQRPFDNLAMMRLNFENRFRTDYLDLPLQPETDPAMVARANLNYLPAFLLLYKYYSASGETEKAKRIEKLAMNIGIAGGKETEVRSYFRQSWQTEDFITGISVKSLDKRMKKVAANLYASETELSNGEFQEFLVDLLRNKDYATLELCKVEKTDWPSLLPDSLRSQSYEQLYPHGHPDGANFPVQNISHEAAELYCQWITKVYNNAADKKKFKRVLFRLPTVQEWEAAASGGKHEVLYPWGGAFVRNAKGCYLGNYKVKPEPCEGCSVKGDRTTDGGWFPVGVDTYFPNNFGLYNMSGNVAEMVAEPGISKGGSWNDEIYYGQIKPVSKMNGRSPSVGFRVFMEVIEE